MPLAYFCAGQAVRFLVGRPQADVTFVAAIATLSSVSVVLAGLGFENLYQTLPFKAAAALALADGIVTLAGKKEKDSLDLALLVAYCGLSAIFLLRLPVYPSIGDDVPSIYGLRRSEIAVVLLALVTLLLPAVAFLVVAKIVRETILGYRSKSERDSLTNLLNRRAFEQVAEEMRHGGGAVVLCDLDHFKAINDRFGHLAGDDVIRSLAALLQETGGSAARLGGEEFALPLPHASVAEAAAIADSVRERFASLGHLKLGEGCRVTASFGVAAFQPQRPVNATIAAADRALYRAKRAGRNRVEVELGDDASETWRAA
nr:GGDEF domain-containing protein [Jiella sonneratiae]